MVEHPKHCELNPGPRPPLLPCGHDPRIKSRVGETRTKFSKRRLALNAEIYSNIRGGIRQTLL